MSKDSLIREGERLDDLQCNYLKIIQNPEKFCFGMDAVLLSAFVNNHVGTRLLDLGTGTGVIPLLLSAKTKVEHLDALEIQTDMVDMARRSVCWNQLENRITIHQGDIKEASALLGRSRYDIITVNPPYMTEHHGLKNPHLPKAIARHEILCNLEDVVRESHALLCPGGHFYMVHRPFRLVEICSVMTKYHIEPKRLRLVHPYLDKEPNMVLIEGVRDGKSRITIEPPLVVYHADQKYTQEILEIYDDVVK
ncbi:MAG: tRNA1(Val) (adenine(37)-N6)-methyltransferase [Lachnospiraceae bacterium]|nr:tRNA1(Val) (adenine(37)-N6)-methyltransferase [Lachnospiraceae bacterium]